MKSLSALMKKNALFHFTIDGLIEIAAGIILLDGGFGYLHFQLTENYYSDPTIYISITPVTLFALLALVTVKRTVVYNRIGYLRLKVDSLKLSTAILACLAVALFLFLLPGQVEKLGGARAGELIKTIEIHLFWVAASVLMFMVAGNFTISRFYFYSILLLAAPAAYIYLPFPYTIASTLIASGASLLALGLSAFYSFLKAYPIHKETGND